MNQYKFIILTNESKDAHELWMSACEQNSQVNYRIVDLTKNSWLDDINREPFDYLLAKPGGLTSKFKQLYDERIYVLDKVLNYKIYPNPDEIFIYENKRYFSFWLRANNIPHPKTDVFYDIDEAKEFIEKETNKKVEFLCWPHGDNNMEAHNMAINEGYKATTIGKADVPDTTDRIGIRIGVRKYKGSVHFGILKALAKISDYKGNSIAEGLKKIYKQTKKI